MTEPLSPAAQAVLDAWEAKLEPMVTCLTHDPEREALAAALRAAANELGYRIIYEDCETEYRIDVTDLLAIAGELETQ